MYTMGMRLRAILAWDNRAGEKLVLQNLKMLSICGIRASAREPPEKLERASTHKDDHTKRPRVTDQVKRPEHRGGLRSPPDWMEAKNRHQRRARGKRDADLSRGRGAGGRSGETWWACAR